MFYFTGTGNTLHVAKKICEIRGNTELIEINNKNCKGFTIEDADRIGFALPVYLFGSPIIVDEFIENLIINNHKYLYVVFTHGGAPYSAVKNFSKKLKKGGFVLNAGYEVNSPNNYIEENNPPNEEEALNIIKKADLELSEIAISIENKTTVYPNKPLWQTLLGSLLQKTFTSYVKKAPKKFKVTDQCNNCSICVSLCPRETIEIGKNNQPIWSGSKCEMCMACINLCPQKAIEIQDKTIGRTRYKNPFIKINELIKRKV